MASEVSSGVSSRRKWQMAVSQFPRIARVDSPAVQGVFAFSFIIVVLHMLEPVPEIVTGASVQEPAVGWPNSGWTTSSLVLTLIAPVSSTDSSTRHR